MHSGHQPHSDPKPETQEAPPPSQEPKADPMAEGFHPDYPRNGNGDPEFGSVVLTLDHMLYRHPFHVVQKMVFSTQDSEEALLGLMEYYHEDHVKLMPSTLDLLVRGRGNQEGSIYIYTVPVTNLPPHPGHVPSGSVSGAVIVQAVLSTPAFYDLINHPDVGKGSSLLAVNWLVEAIVSFLEAQKVAQGAWPPLSLFQLEHGIRPQSQPEEQTKN